MKEKIQNAAIILAVALSTVYGLIAILLTVSQGEDGNPTIGNLIGVLMLLSIIVGVLLLYDRCKPFYKFVDKYINNNLK